MSTTTEWGLAGWTPWYCFWKRTSYPKRRMKPTKYEKKLLNFGYPRTRSCISALFLDRTCSTYTLRTQNSSWRNYTKEFVEVIREVGPYPIRPSPKATNGQTCRKKRTNTWRSATNVRGSHQMCISQEGSSTHYLAHGRLLSRAWISSSHFLRQQGTKDICSSALTTLPNGSKPNL